ncbi:MAG: GNAT family N-acetyltransferase [Candidatus Kapaibacterium sp.]|nr:GNAT family N-acetyltransferase [Bacteroidota bacterium]
MITWNVSTIDELTPRELLSIMILRSDVFVVEQQCIYPDPDTFDIFAHHCYGYIDNVLVAYARILPPGTRFTEPSIGRVVTHPEHRNHGYGKQLMQYAIQTCKQLFPSHSIHISAQCYLIEFYQALGFSTTSEPYDEDGIPHIEMLLD